RGAAEHLERSDVPVTGAQPLPVLATLKLIWTTPTVFCLMLAFMCAMYVNMVLLAWMPDFLHGRFHLSLTKAGLYATLFPQLASMAGSPLGGYLADQLRRRILGGRIAVQALAVLCGAPFVFLCGQLESLSAVLVVLMAW